MIIAVDFDGTLCKHEFPLIGAPNLELIQFLKEAKFKGDKLILWTCRGADKLQEAVEWCKTHDIIFDAVNEDVEETKQHKDFSKDKSCKVYADLYLDDRARFVKYE